MCVWALRAVGDYIHLAARGGEGGNVIYTLIMPAPLNTPLDKCNILAISSSLSLPLFSFIPFPVSQSPVHPEPSAHICSRHNGRSGYVNMYVCRMFTRELVLPLRCCCFYSFAIKTHPSCPTSPFLLHRNLFPGDRQPSPATTPQHQLPWGIKG